MSKIFKWTRTYQKKKIKRFIFSSSLFCCILCLFLLSSIKINSYNDSKNIQSNLIYKEYAYKSSTTPVFIINSPNKYSFYGDIAPNFSLTIIDGLGSYLWYEFLEIGESSVPLKLESIHNETITETFNQKLWSSLTDGDVTIRFYVVNSLGKVGKEDVVVRIDLTDPTLTEISAKSYMSNLTTLQFIIQIWMTLLFIFIFLRRYIKKNIEPIFFSFLLLAFILSFFLFISTNIDINDKVSNIYDDLIYEEPSLKLSTAPTIQINSPSNYNLYGKIAPNFSITIVDGLANYTWYEFIQTEESSAPIKLKGVLNENITGSFNQSLWKNLSNGTVTIRFYANNTLGEVGQADVIVRIDNIDPTINIISPIGGYYNFTAPEFIIEIIEPNLEKMWYTINLNNTKYFFENNESINQNGWNFAPDGIVNITFFANDSVNNTHSSMTQVNKDVNNPIGSIIINGGEEWTNSTSVTITLTYDDATSGVAEVRYSNDGISWTSWEAPMGTRAWILSTGDGLKRVYYEIKDNMGFITQYNDTINLDTTTPSGSIIINDGEVWTNSTSVTLTLTYIDAASGVTEVRYSNDGTSWTAWEAPMGTRAWTLSAGDELKRVYYEIKDNVGFIIQYNDTINLDTTAPTGSIEINGGDAWTNSTSVTLTLIYDDAASGIAEVRYSNDGTSWTGWEAASSTRSWTLSVGDGLKRVYYEIKDNVGFIIQYNDTINLDTIAPTGSIIINDDDTWTNSTSVTLTLTYSDAASGIAEVRYSNDGTSWTGWEAPMATRMWTLSAGDGLKRVYYEIKDNAGSITQYNDTINLDSTAPTGSIEINGDDSWTNSTSVTLTLTFSDAASGVAEVRYSNDGISWTSWEAPMGTRAWILSLGDGLKRVYYEIKDNVGIVIQYNDTINLDTTAPTGSIEINGGDGWTNSTSVTLTLTYNDAASGVTEVRYSNDGTSWTAWEAPMGTRAWTLSAGDELKRVYYEIKDNVGFITQYNDTINLDTTAPSGSIIINDSDVWTNSTSVTLTLTYSDAASGIAEVRYSNDGTSWTGWETASSTRSWTLSPGDGLKRVYYEIKDNVGFITQYNDTIDLDTTAPSGSIIINGGDTWTNSTSVTLTLTYNDAASGVAEVRYSNDGISWTSWEAPLSTLAWTLTMGDGLKRVYYEIKDNVGFITQYNDTIDLDTSAPSGSIIINGGDTWTNSTSVTLTLTYSDAASGVAEVRYSNDGISWTSWEAPLGTRAWTLSIGDGLKRVYYEIKDNVGFITQYNDTIDLDTTAPTGTIEINGGDVWTNSTSVTLTLTYDDAASGVAEVRYSNDGISWTSWEAPLGTRAWTLFIGDGLKRVYYEIKDNVGFITRYNDTINLDTTAPSGSIIINDGDVWTNSTSVTLTLTYSDAASGIAEVRYSNDGTSWTAWEAASSTRSWILLAGDGLKRVYYEIKDNVGFITQYNDTINLDTTAPTGTIQINGGDVWTNSTSVTLTLTYNDAASGVAEVRYSNDGISWTSWEASLGSRAWTLSVGDGLKRVYYEIKDNVGFITQYNDTINLDTTAPTGSIIINDGAVWTNSTSVTLILSYNDAGSGVAEVRYSNDGISWTVWEVASSTRAWTLTVDDGFKRVYYEIKDNVGFITQYNDTINQDTTAPSGSIEINGGDAWTTNTNVMLSLTFNDLTSGIHEVRYSNDSITWTAWESASATKAWILLVGDGPSKIVYYEIKDNVGLISRFSDTIGLDTEPPIIIINLPNNNTYYNVAPLLNITVYDLNFEGDILYFVSGYSPEVLLNNTAEDLRSNIWLDLDQGRFEIRIWCRDHFYHENEILIILYKDTQAPQLTIISPTNMSYCNVEPQIQVTAIDPNFDSVWYVVQGNKIFLSNGILELLDSEIWNALLPEQQFILNIFANDTFGHINATYQITLYKDVVIPSLEINSPANNTLWSSPPQVQITASDMYFDSVWYVIGGIKIMLTNGVSEPLDSSIWDSLPDEYTFIIYFYANDSAGNTNSTFSFYLHKDILAPRISILFPQDDDLFGTSAPAYYISVNELYLDQIWYTLDGGITNFTITEMNGTINQTAWDLFGDGSVTISFYATDTSGKLSFSEITVQKDITAPIITITLPIGNSIFSINSPDFTIYKAGIDINMTWYTLNNGITNYTFIGTTGKIDQDAWALIGNGTVTIRFYINDSLNNIGYDEVTLRKDIIAPTLTINSPTTKLWWNSPPPINISSFDPNLNKIWYRVGSTNITLTNNFEQLLDSAIWSDLKQGEFKIYIYAIDDANNLNQTVITLFKDTLPPVIIVNSPTNNTYYNSVPSINITIYDPNFDGDILYFVSGYSPEILVNNTAEDLRNNIWLDLESGDFIEIRIWCRDSFFHESEIILILYKDTQAPRITINSPEDQSSWNSPPIISIIASDPNLNCTWYRYGSDIFFIPNDGTPVEFDNDIWDSLFDGPFTIEIYANDSFGYLNNSFILTLFKDMIPPMITVNLPINGTVCNEAPNIYVSSSDPDIDSIWYVVSGTKIILINGLSERLDASIWNDLPDEGYFTIYFYANDTAGNINSSIILTLFKDLIAPTIIINDPDDYDLFGTDTISFNLSLFDPNLNTTWYSLYTDTTGWSINITLTTGQTSGIIDYTLWQACPSGTVIIRFYSNDTLGNTAFKQILIYKDSDSPNIEILLPLQDECIGPFHPNYNVTIEDPHLYRKWYILINATNPLDSTGKYFFTSNTGSITAWDLFGDGEIIIRFYANDSLGNVNYAEISVVKDVTAPIINIEYPEMWDLFGTNAPNFMIFKEGEDIDTVWYILRNATYTSRIYIFTGVSGPIDQEAWNIFNPGKKSTVIYINIIFYINDTVGNKNFASVMLGKNILPPSVAVNSPIDQTYWNRPPIINVSAFDLDMSTIWYRVGTTSITLANNTEQILDASIWSNLPQGEFQIYIFANDSQGNINNTYILTLYKDTIAPNITILLPNEGDKIWREPPLFEISIQEVNLEAYWYTLKGTHQNITFVGDLGRIDEELWISLWDTLIEGESIIIQFYASDTAGNIGFSEVEVIKTLSEPSEPSEPFNLLEILGGPVGLLLSGVSLALLIPSTFILRKSRYYKSLDKDAKTKVGRILLLVYTSVFLIFLAFVF